MPDAFAGGTEADIDAFGNDALMLIFAKQEQSCHDQHIGAETGRVASSQTEQRSPDSNGEEKTTQKRAGDTID